MPSLEACEHVRTAEADSLEAQEHADSLGVNAHLEGNSLELAVVDIVVLQG